MWFRVCNASQYCHKEREQQFNSNTEGGLGGLSTFSIDPTPRLKSAILLLIIAWHYHVKLTTWNSNTRIKTIYCVLQFASFSWPFLWSNGLMIGNFEWARRQSISSVEKKKQRAIMAWCLIYYSPCCPLEVWISVTGTAWATVDWGETGRVTTWGWTALKIWNASVANKLSVFKGDACVAVRFPCKVTVGSVFDVAMVIVTLPSVSWHSGCCVVCCGVAVSGCVFCCRCCCCCDAVCWACVGCCGWVVDVWICCTGWTWWTICNNKNKKTETAVKKN